MKILLDTHVFLWCVKEDSKLSKKLRKEIEAASEIFVSSASIWEASIKASLGKLDVNIDDLVAAISLSGFTELPVTSEHAAYVYHLPNLHRDPFDRLLLSQAITEPLRLITADEFLKEYSDLVYVISS
jgi:PIN domain nuclease of toxin-antitoxin system